MAQTLNAIAYCTIASTVMALHNGAGRFGAVCESAEHVGEELHCRMDELFGDQRIPGGYAATDYHPKLIPQLARFLEPANPPTVLLRACALASVYPEAENLQALLQLIDHANAEVRAAALSSLVRAQVHDEAPRGRILQACLDELRKPVSVTTFPSARVLVAHSLAFEDERIVPALVDTLERVAAETDPSLHHQRIRSLEHQVIRFLGRARRLSPKSGPRLAGSALVAVLHGERSTMAKYYAAQSLGQLGLRTPDVVNALTDGLANRRPICIPVILPDTPMVIPNDVPVTVAGASADALRRIGLQDERISGVLEEAIRTGKLTRTDMLAVSAYIVEIDAPEHGHPAWRIIRDCTLKLGVYNRSGERCSLDLTRGFGPPPGGDTHLERRHCQFEALNFIARIGPRARHLKRVVQSIHVEGNEALAEHVARALSAIRDD